MIPRSSPDPAGLRRAAEARLKQRRATTLPRTGADPRRLQQELEVHQIEVELQNESLLNSQEDLQAALERYADFYDFSPVGYLTLGPDGVIRHVNLTAAKFLGVERSFLVRRSLVQFVCPADLPALATFLVDVFEGKGRESCEVTLANAAAPPRVVRLEAVAVPSGQECRAVLSDISVHKHDHGLLRRSEERYRNLFEIMVQGVVCQDAAGHIFAANPAAERILGLTLDQMQGRTSADPRWQAIHEDGSNFPSATHPAMVALRSGKPVRDVIMGVYHPVADRLAWINVNAIPEFRPGSTASYQVYTTFEDITERKRTEAALRQWADAFEHCAHGIGLGVSGTNQVMVCNPALGRMIGCPVETLTGSPAISLYAAAEHERVRQYHAEAERVGQVRFEARMVRAEGTAFPVQMDLVSVRDAEGKPRYNVATVQDITERQQAENLNRLQHDLALALGASSNLPAGLRACLDAAIGATGLDSGGCYLLDEATGALELCTHRGLSPEFADSAAHLEPGSAQTRLVMAGKPVYAQFSEMRLAPPEVQLRAGLRFLAMVPLSHNDRTIGCLIVASHTLDDLPDPLRLVRETIAAKAASAIVRLQAEQALRDSEERFRQMAEKINSVL